MRHFNINNSIISVYDHGQGEPIVFLHSSASNAGQWNGVFKHLPDTYRVIAPNLLGYGFSSAWSGPGHMRIADEARNVIALINRLGIRAHLVGHSFGGAVAMHIAKSNPCLLQTLTLIEPSAFNVLASGTADDNKYHSEILALAQDVTEAVEARLYRAAAQRFIDYWNGTGTFDAMPTERQKSTCAAMTKVAMEFGALGAEPPFVTSVEDIDIPTLIIAGTRSPKSVRCISRILNEKLKCARHRTIANAGHMLPITHPVAVAEHLKDQFAKRDPGHIHRTA
ncbi:alpha/beta hydrolase [Thalassospiraceae bacterium LMO-JJ14]|nr:alpha/beta hydrolase [Thalassospiraceae bacterium LMO-JJ14]